MVYQSEAELEDNLIKKLRTQKYDYVKIENEEIAIQTDCPLYEGDKEVDLYVKLSDVIEVLQKNAPLQNPLLDKHTN